MPSDLKLDHLIVACPSLDEGIEWAAKTLGVRPPMGGQHVAMGTHNALLALQDGIYLELIAIDPSLPTPLRPRWFGLDDTPLTEPRLWHAVLSTRNIHQLSQPHGQGEVIPMQRKHFSWLISVPASGALPSPQGAPTLIQWECEQHPTETMSDVGLRLQSLTIKGPDAALPNLYAGVDRISVEPSSTYSIHAVLQTPLGLLTL
jgi:Glyoxalase-like domain